MKQPRKDLVDLLRPRLVDPGFNDGAFLKRFDEILDAGGMRRDAAAPAPAPTLGALPFTSGTVLALTPRVAMELVDHEAMVLEAYKDSANVWTWGIGVTDKSGHSVLRYKDNPQPISHVLAIYIWLLRNNYLPDVLRAFKGFPLTEAQLAAALSFHYNTGAILGTEWVGLWKSGKADQARRFLESHYLNGGDLTERRGKEAALFFDGKWSQDGKAKVIPVRKPSYTPNWSGTKLVDITADLVAAIAAT